MRNVYFSSNCWKYIEESNLQQRPLTVPLLRGSDYILLHKISLKTVDLGSQQFIKPTPHWQNLTSRIDINCFKFVRSCLLSLSETTPMAKSSTKVNVVGQNVHMRRQAAPLGAHIDQKPNLKPFQALGCEQRLLLASCQERDQYPQWH